MLHDNKGFSLIELMIVMAIINILASIAIPNYMTYKDRAQFQACRVSLRALEFAQLMHYLDTGEYTNSGDDLAFWVKTQSDDAAGLNQTMSDNCLDFDVASSITVTGGDYTVTTKAKGRYACTITMNGYTGYVTPENYTECRKMVGD